jgi:hypothetical protein|nr:hypothetical protein [uncultured Mediterranean phage uvMED]
MATYESKKYATIPIAATQVADGSVTNAEYQFINTLASNAQTQITAKLPLSGGTITGDTTLTDNQALRIGTGLDLRLFHDGNNSKINNTTGELRIAGDSIKLMNQAESETHLTATADGAVGLRHNNVEKLVTSASGVTISGTLAATAVTGDASGMSNLPTGPTGPPGGTGPTGPTGPSGPTGPAGTSGIAASSGDVGDIRPFLLMRSSGSGGSVSLSAGTTFTPSSYSSSNMIIANYGTSIQNISLSSNTLKYGALHGYASLSNHTSGSASSYSGTWRVIFPLISGSATGGQGNSSYTYYYSLAGMAQRIS